MGAFRIPRSLFLRSVDLSSLGLRERAWKLDVVGEVLDRLQHTEVGVPGGDLYSSESGQFEPTYENWYVDPLPGEAPKAFAARSLAVARGYVERAKQHGSENRWVVLVLTEPLLADEVTEQD